MVLRVQPAAQAAHLRQVKAQLSCIQIAKERRLRVQDLHKPMCSGIMYLGTSWRALILTIYRSKIGFTTFTDNGSVRIGWKYQPYMHRQCLDHNLAWAMA